MKYYILALAFLLSIGLFSESFNQAKEIDGGLGFLTTCLLLGLVGSKKGKDWCPLSFMVLIVAVTTISFLLWKLLDNLDVSLSTYIIGAVISIWGLGFFKLKAANFG